MEGKIKERRDRKMKGRRGKGEKERKGGMGGGGEGEGRRINEKNQEESRGRINGKTERWKGR